MNFCVQNPVISKEINTIGKSSPIRFRNGFMLIMQIPCVDQRSVDWLVTSELCFIFHSALEKRQWAFITCICDCVFSHKCSLGLNRSCALISKSCTLFRSHWFAAYGIEAVSFMKSTLLAK